MTRLGCIADLLAERTEPGENGCLIYTGPLCKQGYGRLYDGTEKRLVHRIAHELYIGPIPDGLQVDHLCGTRSCVNPAHLEAVTPLVNSRRAANGNAQKDRCVNGHEFTPENTRLISGRVGRACRRCDAERQRVYRAKDGMLERRRAYFEANREHINALRRKRRAIKRAAA